MTAARRLPAALPAAGLLLAALAPAAVSAQAPGSDAAGAPPLVGDRPDFTESASVVTGLQLETGYTLERVGTADVHTVGELLVRIPATRRVELRVGVPSWTREVRDGPAAATVSGFTDASLGLKVGLRDPGPGGSGPSVALLAGATLPTGEVGSETADPGARLAAGLDLSERFSLGANLGVRSLEEGGDRHGELSGSLALGVAVSGPVGAYLEAYGFAPWAEDPGGPASSSVLDGGLTWLAGPDLQLDVRLGTGLSGPSPDLIFGTGVIWRP